MTVNFAYGVSLIIPLGFLTYRKILRRGADRFISPAIGAMLRTFITLKNASSSAGFEPANLGRSGKHVTTRLSRATC
jgi:hypothetical protein